ncbi:phytoene desaturase family protein [Lysinibacillus antri]|uniref:FAD-dependent oxidoreductase n=1 Tax=Lysinibacillus antri TaxID=2498145 RepID=A0A3S0PN50_9BACI|nr:NAD(P)/FAD-dependent oxidoreductase [Lysinibacillus antri]RUL49603.1 FAD-dependent oxidoreductase [Lysinibacillus antri]
MGKTVGILGAGIGGLMAGAFLAVNGYQVSVFEKATTVGGSAGWYHRKGRRFPTGATLAFGLEEHGLLQNLLAQLQIELEIENLDHPMDVILKDRKISIYQDTKRWNEELQLAFPEKSKEVQQFWDELTFLGESVHSVTASGVSLPIRHFTDLGKMPQYLITHPLSLLRLGRYASWTVEDLLRKHELASYVPLRSFLNAQLLDAAQTDITEAALLPSSLALTIYRRGSFHVKNGIGQLSQVLADKIRECGGEIYLSSPVSSLRYDNNSKDWHITSKKHSSFYDFVINNTGVSFGPGTSHADHNQSLWGAFRIDAVLHKSVWQKELNEMVLPFAFQIATDSAGEEIKQAIDGPIYITFQQTNNQKGEIIEDEITMTCSVHIHNQVWLSYSKDVYEEKKRQLTNAILTEIEEVVAVREYLQYAIAGTPLTYQRYVGKAGVGGFPLTITNAILKPKSVRSSHPNLYLVGEQSFPGPGTLSAGLSGYHAARIIINNKK